MYAELSLTSFVVVVVVVVVVEKVFLLGKCGICFIQGLFFATLGAPKRELV